MKWDYSQGAIQDPHVEIVLDWLIALSDDPADLERRIARARRFYLTNAYPKGRWWPDTSTLVPADDEIAGFIAQAGALLSCKKGYDLYLGSRIVPFFKAMGMSFDLLRQAAGIKDRVRRLLRAATPHPQSGLFELVTAARYARAGFTVEFIPESQEKTADLEISGNSAPKGTRIECKRLQASDYEKRESVLIDEQNASAARWLLREKLSLHVDVQYLSELKDIPSGYLAGRLDAALEAIKADGVAHWGDAFMKVSVAPARLEEVRKDLETTFLRNDSKLARLLTGAYQPEGTYLISLSAWPSSEDPRYIDKLSYASVVTWHSMSVESIQARSRHIRSVLGKVDKQLKAAGYGIAHVGMESERDALTADLRRERNILEVATFFPESELAEVHMHYFLPRSPEMAAWTIDETIDSRSKVENRVLADARVLHSNEIDIDDDTPAWHLPPPPSYDIRE